MSYSFYMLSCKIFTSEKKKLFINKTKVSNITRFLNAHHKTGIMEVNHNVNYLFFLFIIYFYSI